MSTAKHTPGTWVVGYGKVRGLDGEHLGVGLPEPEPGGNWRPVALISRAEEVTDFDLANAALIASSPRLLASLKWALSAMAARNPMWTEGENYAEAMAAVAAAEGQP